MSWLYVLALGLGVLIGLICPSRWPWWLIGLTALSVWLVVIAVLKLSGVV